MNDTTNMPTLDTLAERLAVARQAESAARDRRIELEQMICTHPDVAPQLTDEGTVTVGTLKVRTGFTRSWDQKALDAISVDVAEEYWPFKAEWKEDRKAARVIEERFPDLWEAIRGALTLKPSKPAVTIVERKAEAA